MRARKRKKPRVLGDLEAIVRAMAEGDHLRIEETDEGLRILEACWGGAERVVESQNNSP